MLPLLRIQDLSIEFRSASSVVKAVRNISFAVNRGEVLAIAGESGSGKSVTALSLLQLLPSPPAKYSGHCHFSEDGITLVDLVNLDARLMQQIRGNSIGMIFQEPMSSLNPLYTCGNQVAEAILQHKKLTRRQAIEQTVEWFSRVRLPDPVGISGRYPHQLSGGQKQRVMIAMAMCCQPSLLICDEPTTALDVTVQRTILDLIMELRDQYQPGVIFITHDLGVVGEIADRAIMMYKGEIVEENTVSKLFTNPAHVYTKSLLACRPSLYPRGIRLPVVAEFMKGDINSPVQTGFRQPASILAVKKEVLIDVQNLTVEFPTKKNLFGTPLKFLKAVDDVSFQVFKGETLGLVGESGCGKTTLGRTLLHLIQPASGRVIYNGTDLNKIQGKALMELRKDIQIIFQDPYSSLNPRLTVGSAIAEPLRIHNRLHSQKKRKEKVIDILEKVDLRPEHYDRHPHEFSGGQRQRIVIARALILEPSFLVCDEPVSALDMSVQAQVLNLINDLKAEFGFTVVFISHDLSVIRYISDRIMVMNRGKIVEAGYAEEVYINPQTEYTRELIRSIPSRQN